MRHLMTIIVLLLTISACAMLPKERAIDFSCPELGFINNSDTATVEGIDIIIRGISSECGPVKDAENKLDISLNLPFETYNRLYKTTLLEEISVPYFIAILGPNEELLQRTVFSTILEFNEDGDARSEEEHHIGLNVNFLTEAYKYKIVVGFIKE
ncbi:MAG: hypothetical protein GY793_07395 [Proteobacteria bacterium]|nr:hypothetical protein [Pseudomonadota bacterium]